MDTTVDSATNPIGTELVFEDERVRIWRIELEPGQEAGWHTHHLDYTSVIIEGDVVERPNDDGTVDRIEVTPGAFMRWHQGTLRHALRNAGTKRFRNVIVEIKGASTGA
jgi:quercetin dioxygenase-like cupin family protein